MFWQVMKFLTASHVAQLLLGCTAATEVGVRQGARGTMFKQVRLKSDFSDEAMWSSTQEVGGGRGGGAVQHVVERSRAAARPKRPSGTNSPSKSKKYYNGLQ